MTSSAMSPFTFGYVALVAAACGMAAWERIVALRNERRLRAAGAEEIAPGVFLAMVPAYALQFPAAVIEHLLRARPPAPAFAAAMVVAFVAAKVLKLRVIRALGDRFTMRVFVPRHPAVVTGGPYRFVRHPNYVAVMAEILALALAGGAVVTAIVFGSVFAVILRFRVRSEEAALLRHPDYAAFAAGRGRFVPRRRQDRGRPGGGDPGDGRGPARAARGGAEAADPGRHRV